MARLEAWHGSSDARPTIYYTSLGKSLCLSASGGMSTGAQDQDWGELSETLTCCARYWGCQDKEFFFFSLLEAGFCSVSQAGVPW